jgi:Immunity protein 26
MKLPYSEGSVFLVPLRDGGYAKGVVARAAPEGKVLFGYFFGPKIKSTEDIVVGDLTPGKEILKVRFGDLGLINGKWPVRGHVSNWSRSEWTMPDFVRREPISNRTWLVRYSDTDPSRVVSEELVDPACSLPTDSTSGSGSVEIKLTKLLAGADKRP